MSLNRTTEITCTAGGQMSAPVAVRAGARAAALITGAGNATVTVERKGSDEDEFQFFARQPYAGGDERFIFAEAEEGVTFRIGVLTPEDFTSGPVRCKLSTPR